MLAALAGCTGGDDVVAPTTTTSATSESTIECDAHVVVADVDGDGTDERIVHEWIDDGAVLAVCFDDGGVSSMPGAGMSEGALRVLDLGRPVIEYGATTACAAGSALAIVADGELRQIHGALLWQGCASDGDGTEAWGCAGTDIVTVHAATDGRWVRAVRRLDGDRLRLDDINSGQADPPAVQECTVVAER